jgi:terminase large subunit-like protein
MPDLIIPAKSEVLTPRWKPLRYHPVQHAYWRSPHRFNLVSAGRRSGKTELAKRKIIRSALRGTIFDNPRFFAAAPTRDQAKRIYWQDLKALTPPYMLARAPYEGDMIIPLINDAEIHVLGMDKPARLEGSPWDGGVLDEYGNMKANAWDANVRPALADRNGWCDLIGVPEGRNHYYDLDLKALAEVAELGDRAEFGSFTWHSADILDPAEIEAAKRNMHPKLYLQEYEGSFVDFSGLTVFEKEKLLLDGRPLPYPTKCDAVFAVIDTAVKEGKTHDGTAVTFFAYNRVAFGANYPLMVLDWDIIQIDGALLIDWLPSVFVRLEELSRICGARMMLGAHIEDRMSGSILIQQARRQGKPAIEIDNALVEKGKDGRALSTSGYVYSGRVKICDVAFNKTKDFKEQHRNHFLTQVCDFKIGQADGQPDDLLDTFCYGIAIALGDDEGF